MLEVTSSRFYTILKSLEDIYGKWKTENAIASHERDILHLRNHTNFKLSQSPPKRLKGANQRGNIEVVPISSCRPGGERNSGYAAPPDSA